MSEVLTNTDGSVYHLGILPGEIANKIVIVGDLERASRAAAEFLEKVKVRKTSSRFMRTITGEYKGQLVSIVGIGMGAPMVDFFMREASHILGHKVPMKIIRVGTCGVWNESVTEASLMTAGKGMKYSFLDYSEGGHEAPQVISKKPTMGDAELNEMLVRKAKELGLPVFDGMGISAENFYSAQGRELPGWTDKKVAAENKKKIVDSGADFCEMETHQLFLQAAMREAKTQAAGIHVGIVHRSIDYKVDDSRRAQLELGAIEAGLEAVTTSI